MNSEIERVARAICEANFGAKGAEGEFGNVDDCWWAFKDQAEAAIAAMPLQSLLAQAQEANRELSGAARQAREALEAIIESIGDDGYNTASKAADRLTAALQPNAGEGR